METHTCPECQEPLQFVEDAPFEAQFSGRQFTVPLGTEIWRCSTHGLFRVHQTGKIEPYRE